jgi:cysteine desulfurase
VTSDPIYLDHNATTPLLPEVVDAMLPHLRTHFGNPSSGHVYGVRAARAVDEARAQVAALLGCDADEIVFTSGGTEANNLAIRGVIDAGERRGVVTSVIEHPATARPCDRLEALGHAVVRAGVDALGVVRLDEVAATISGETALVTVMHSHNETGVLQPIEAIASMARAAGAVMHTDAAQSVGKVPIDVRALGVDLLSVAGHKLYAPKGVGALYVRRGTRIVPFVRGAGHERGLRPGTENVASLVGLGAACAIAMRDLGEVRARVEALRDALCDRLAASVPGLVVHGVGPNGARAPRLPNTLHVRFPRASGEAILRAAPEVAASTGSACHDGHDTPSAAIVAMGVAPIDALGSVRLTLGRSTSAHDVARAADALARAWRALSP